MKAMVLSRPYPGKRLEGLARVMNVREEVLEDEAVHVFDLANATGTIQAFVPHISLPSERPALLSHVHASGVVSALWEGGAVALRLETIRPVEASTRSIADGQDAAFSALDDANEGILIELPDAFAAYLLWLITSDLARWTEERRSRLTRDDVRGFALYLHDQLPTAMRSPLPPANAGIKRTRARRAA